MSSKWIQVAATALIAVVLLSGCGKKPPEIPAPAPPPPAPMEPTTVVEPPPAPPVVDDGTPDWETGELAELDTGGDPQLVAQLGGVRIGRRRGIAHRETPPQ